MSLPERHELPNGTPVFSGAGCPFDENGVDLTLIDAMLAMTPALLLRALTDGDVRFIVVGGLAAVAQGAPIVTFDVDIVHGRLDVLCRIEGGRGFRRSSRMSTPSFMTHHGAH